MNELIAKPTYTAKYGTDILVGTFPDNGDVAEFRVLTGGPYRGALGGNSTFGFWCMEACMRCDEYPPCITIPKKISLPKNAPIFIRKTIFSDKARMRFLKIGTKDVLSAQLDKFHADLGGKPCGFHLYAIRSPEAYANQLLVIPVQSFNKTKKAASRR